MYFKIHDKKNIKMCQNAKFYDYKKLDFIIIFDYC